MNFTNSNKLKQSKKNLINLKKIKSEYYSLNIASSWATKRY